MSKSAVSMTVDDPCELDELSSRVLRDDDSPPGEASPMANDVVVSISVRTLLVAAGIVAVAGALASIGSALLMILVSVLCVAVLARGDRNGAAPGLEPGAVLDGARPGDSHRLAVVLLVLAQAVQRRGARIHLRPARDRGPREAQRCGRLHQRWQRLARHVEGARQT